MLDRNEPNQINETLHNMVASRRHKKLFYDLDDAMAFGEIVDRVGEHSTVPTGASGKPKSIFSTGFVAREQEQHIGDYHYIEKNTGVHKQDTYNVCYNIINPSGSKRADVLLVEREAKASLDQKYQEMGPDIGIMRM